MEDETDIANVVVTPDLHERDRWQSSGTSSSLLKVYCRIRMG
jgi:hypothetical protein